MPLQSPDLIAHPFCPSQSHLSLFTGSIHTASICYGYTLNLKGYKLLKDWQKTPLGELIGEAYTRMIPAKDLMGTAEVQRVFKVKRQTIYDWVDEGKLVAYYIHGKQMFYRPYIQLEAEKRTRTKAGVQQL